MEALRPRVSVVADDLTGALDTVAAFADRGWSVAVATRPDALDEALAQGAEVVAVNSDTRDAHPVTAAATVAALAIAMAGRGGLFFKKIDSRLKGHVAAETSAMLAALGRSRVVVSPAIPALGRLVENGMIVGAGVDAPIAIRDSLPDDVETVLGDVRSAQDLVPFARAILADPHRVLALGASGLAEAIAGCFPAREVAPLPFSGGGLLMLIGSRDPVTLAQVESLRRVRPDVRYIVVRQGQTVSLPTPDGSALLHGLGSPGAPSARAIAIDLAGIAAPIIETGIGAVLACGGDTAAALMTALGMRVLRPCGQALPGAPICAFEHRGRTVLLATKSGGFGDADTLVTLAELLKPRKARVAGNDQPG